LQDLQNKQEVSTKSSLKCLHPFVDQEGLLRVGGRLQQSSLPYDAVHQLVLPSNHHFTRLFVFAEHMRLLLAGSQLLIASVRQRFWIPHIKTLIKSVIHQCLTCYKLKVQASIQLMGELPCSKVQPSRVFRATGIDYAGPLMFKLGNPRSKTVIKGYIAVFVCLAVKAVHLEVVTSRTTAAFIAALRRFIARRGTPSTIYSDSGTNFKGAANHFQELHKLLQSSSHVEQVQDYLSKEKREWKFIPPHSPQFGGLWEAEVKSMKYHLRRILGNNICTYEEVITITANIEACLNSRPLCTFPNDPSHSYLSPRHFLIGVPLTTLPSLDLTNVKSNRLSRWQQLQQQAQHFWQGWSADYLQELSNDPNGKIQHQTSIQEIQYW
jgi:hypothetical protein